MTLPVCGWPVGLRALSGAHELLLRDEGVETSDAECLIELFGAVAEAPDRDWRNLPISDGDALMLHLRRQEVVDQVEAHIECSKEGCGTRINISFSIAAYLSHHAPKPRYRHSADEDGWHCLDGVRFRPPTLGDEVASLNALNPALELRRRCVQGNADSRQMSRIEKALARIAPSLTNSLQAQCPQCGAILSPVFDPRAFVLTELRDQAAFLDVDVHLIASTYHWSLREILDLPRARRVQFAERIRSDRVGAA